MRPWSITITITLSTTRCETLVRVEEVDHTEEECTICKQGYTMEVVEYTDTECVTTYRDSCSWGGDPNRVWSRDVKSYLAITFWQQRTYYRRYVLNSEMDGLHLYLLCKRRFKLSRPSADFIRLKR